MVMSCKHRFTGSALTLNDGNRRPHNYLQIFCTNSCAKWKNRRTPFSGLSLNSILYKEQAVSIARILGTSVEYLAIGEDSSDPWLRENRQFLDDCKVLRPDQFGTIETLAHVQADEIRGIEHIELIE